MDHDKQVITTQDTIGRFLNRPLIMDDRDRETFDLEAEFAKSAKNKSPLIPLVVAAFLVLLAIGAWVASQFTEAASQKSSASIGSFEDLKLKEIFDTVRKNKKDLETLQAQMAELTQASNARVAALVQAGNSQADIASVNDATGAQAKAIQARAATQVAAERATLKAQLAPLQAQAAEVQKKIDSYDDRITQMNKKNQQVLDTQQRLFDLEKKKIVDQYEARLEAQTTEARTTLARVKQERDDLVTALKAKAADDIRKLILKYNPVLEEGVASHEIAQHGTAVAAYPGPTLPDRLSADPGIDAQLLTSVKERVARAQMLVAELKKIPYQNSVPGLINSLDVAIADSLAGYEAYFTPVSVVLTTLDTNIAELQQKLADLQIIHDAYIADRLAADQVAADEKAAATAYLGRWTGAVDDFVATLKEDGVFVDMRNATDWIVVLKADRAKALQAAIDASIANPVVVAAGKTPPPPVNLATIRDGLTNSELGTVTIEATARGWTAKLVKLNDPKKAFKAFDRITLALAVKK